MAESYKTFEWKDVETRYQTFVVRGSWVKHGSTHRRVFYIGDSLPELLNPKEIWIEQFRGEVDAETRARLLSIVHNSVNIKKVYLYHILTPEESEELFEFATCRFDLRTTSLRNEKNHYYETYRKIPRIDK